jgi:hypothetical protein
MFGGIIMAIFCVAGIVCFFLYAAIDRICTCIENKKEKKK